MSLKGRGVARTQSPGPTARIFVATPTYDGTLHHRYVSSYTAAMLYCLYHRVELELHIVAGSSLIQYARNQLLREFLADKSCTHILWIDADVGFDPRAIMQLMESGKDVIGGVYPMKTQPMEWPYEPLPGEQKAGLHRAKTMPGGFLLCSRASMEATAETAETYKHHMAGMIHDTKHVFDVVLEDGLLLGEDVILSQRVRKSGYEVWVDPDINFSHCGQYEWRGNMNQAIEQGVISTPMNHQTLMRVQSSDPEVITESADELYRAWGNKWAPPPPELSALALLAKKSKRILECGSGLSTIIMAAANPDAEIHSLEQDEEWARKVIHECRNHGLDNVTIHYTPLSESDWFYEVPADLPSSFDLAFIDGPTFLDGTSLEKSTDVRLPAYDKLASRIENAILVIDDIDHYGEIASRYDQKEIVGNRFAICLPNQKAEAA